MSRALLKTVGECAGALSTPVVLNLPAQYAAASAGYSESVHPIPEQMLKAYVGEFSVQLLQMKKVTDPCIPCAMKDVSNEQYKGENWQIIWLGDGYTQKQHLFSMASAILLHKALCSLH